MKMKIKIPMAISYQNNEPVNVSLSHPKQNIIKLNIIEVKK